MLGGLKELVLFCVFVGMMLLGGNLLFCFFIELVCLWCFCSGLFRVVVVGFVLVREFFCFLFLVSFLYAFFWVGLFGFVEILVAGGWCFSVYFFCL